MLCAGNRVGLSQEEDMPTGICPPEQRVKSGLEFLKHLKELFDLCGLDEADPQGSILA